jgi:hypothetical protein
VLQTISSRSRCDRRLEEAGSERPQDAYRAHRNAITGACYSAAKPSHRDDQGYSVVDSTDKERIVDGRRPGTARPLPQGSPHEAPPYVRARTALSQLSVNAWL